MHLLATTSTNLDEIVEAVDLGQSVHIQSEDYLIFGFIVCHCIPLCVSNIYLSQISFLSRPR